MKFLVDENLSARIARALESDHPGSRHVLDLDLQRADDRTLWELALAEGFTILSKDTDFLQLSLVHRAPPRVVWVNTGNVSTARILETLRAGRGHLEEFAADEEASLLCLTTSGTS